LMDVFEELKACVNCLASEEECTRHNLP
jgi:hypothetical protein